MRPDTNNKYTAHQDQPHIGKISHRKILQPPSSQQQPTHPTITHRKTPTTTTTPLWSNPLLNPITPPSHPTPHYHSTSHTTTFLESIFFSDSLPLLDNHEFLSVYCCLFYFTERARKSQVGSRSGSWHSILYLTTYLPFNKKYFLKTNRATILAPKSVPQTDLLVWSHSVKYHPWLQLRNLNPPHVIFFHKQLCISLTESHIPLSVSLSFLSSLFFSLRLQYWFPSPWGRPRLDSQSDFYLLDEDLYTTQSELQIPYLVSVSLYSWSQLSHLKYIQLRRKNTKTNKCHHCTTGEASALWP